MNSKPRHQPAWRYRRCARPEEERVTEPLPVSGDWGSRASSLGVYWATINFLVIAPAAVDADQITTLRR